MLPVEYKIGRRLLYAEPGGQALFTNNETHSERVFGPDVKSRSPFVKDAFHRYIIQREQCVNPAQQGTKACVHYANQIVPAGGSIVFRFRFTNEPLADPLKEVETIISQRRAEADEFYAALHPPKATEDERRIQRQALAGLLWNKQHHLYHVRRWPDGDDPD